MSLNKKKKNEQKFLGRCAGTLGAIPLDEILEISLVKPLWKNSVRYCEKT